LTTQLENTILQFWRVSSTKWNVKLIHTLPLSLHNVIKIQRYDIWDCNSLLEWWVLCSAYFTIKYRYKKCQSLFLTDFFLLNTRNKLSFIVCCCLNVELYHQIFTTAVAANRISASYRRTNVHSARRKKMFTALKQIF